MPKGVFVHKRTPAWTRFIAKVRKKANTKGCWEWIPCKGRDAYGYFWNGEKADGAHRYALEVRLGRSLTRGECALHSCDNKWCVNADHLFPGTDADNSKDMVIKGRKERGEDVYGAILTRGQVKKIRKLFVQGWTPSKLASVFGSTADNIRAVIRGFSWAWAGGPIDPTPMKRGPKKGIQQRIVPKFDLTGLHFGRLTVERPVRVKDRAGFLWVCRCECGNQTKPLSVSKGTIERGGDGTLSCGCLLKEVLAAGGGTKWKK